MRIHHWTDADIVQLEQAVLACTPLFRLYASGQNKEYGSDNAWDAVAGRLVPDIAVTGSACQRQWDKIQREKLKENHAMADGWADAIVAVQEYEETILERIDRNADMLPSILERIASVEAKITLLCTELGYPEDPK